MPEVWDGLVGRNFYSSAGWLSFCKKDFGGESQAAVVLRDGRPVCAMPFVEAQDSLFASYRWHETLSRFGLPSPRPRGILVGSREGYQTHILSGDTDPSTADVEALLRQLRAMRLASNEAGDSACVAMYVTTADAVAFQKVGVTATPVLLEPDAWIRIGEDGWFSWSEAIPPKRRRNILREFHRFQEAGYRIDQVSLAECCESLGELPSSTLVKYGHESDPTDEMRALRHHVTCMQDAARTALCRGPDGELVGFCLYYVWRDTIFLRWTGFNYGRLVGAGEYFNVCYYPQIELAGSLGVRWLHAGIKSVEAKALRGAELRPLWLVDLTEGSPLEAVEPQIRRHNARGLKLLTSDPRTAGMVDEAAWEPFI